MTITVQQRQSVLDIALQYFGSIEAAFLVAERLGVSITDRLTAGMTLEYDASEIIDNNVVAYYAKNNIVPTTEIE